MCLYGNFFQSILNSFLDYKYKWKIMSDGMELRPDYLRISLNLTMLFCNVLKQF